MKITIIGCGLIGGSMALALKRQRQEWGKSLGLREDLVEELFGVILRHSSRVQADR